MKRQPNATMRAARRRLALLHVARSGALVKTYEVPTTRTAARATVHAGVMGVVR